MKRLVILIALLVMNAICVQGVFAQEIIVERQIDLSIKFYRDGVVSDLGANRTGITFTYTTADLITRLGMATGTTFSSHAILIEQEYFDGIASMTMPTEPYMLKLLVRDGLNDVDVSTSNFSEFVTFRIHFVTF
jgi:F0F1-type ATP synthase membrane subunit a